MKIQQYAMEKEKAAKEYYENLSKCAKNPGIRKIFDLLAEEEQRHQNVLEDIGSYAGMDKETGLLKEATGLLVSSFRQEGESQCDSEAISAYRKAIEMEEESIGIYENALAESVDSMEKEAFMILSAQERKHKLILENIIDYVTKPDRTIPHAEFARFDPDDPEEHNE